MLEAAKLPNPAKVLPAWLMLVMDRLFDRWFILPTLKVRCKFMKEPEACRSGRTKEMVLWNLTP